MYLTTLIFLQVEMILQAIEYEAGMFIHLIIAQQKIQYPGLVYLALYELQFYFIIKID